jgi:hypothetical protein
MIRARRPIIILAIALGIIILLTLLIAPTRSDRQRSSTYGRSPEGYGAWYAYMKDQGTVVNRWQKSEALLFEAKSEAAKPKTLLRIGKDLTPSPDSEAWVKAGNVLVLVGAIADASVTNAPFTSDVASPSGIVRIDTSRRYRPDSQQTPLLQDSFGAVVRQKDLGKGRLISVITTHFAANAYQDFAANYEVLAKLVTSPGHPIWVDEYLHGYKDKTAETKDGKPIGNETLLGYLGKTPLALLAIQAIVVLLVLIWGQNRRFGLPKQVEPPAIDNSQVYIQALASILQKADNSEFVLETLGKAEQLDLQKALGLGTIPLSSDVLAFAWTQQTGQPADRLTDLLRTAARHHRISEAELSQWIETMDTVRSQTRG